MKKVILTGVSDVLGKEIAALLLEKGYAVVGISRSKPEDKRIAHIVADITNEKQLAGVIKDIKENHRDFSALINCAGIFFEEKFEALTYEALRVTLETNVIAPMMLVSGLADLIKKNEADVVNVASTVAYKAFVDQAAYGASKWALRGFSENLRMEMKETRCRVINFCPGAFQSRFTQKHTDVGDIDLSPYMRPKNVAQVLINILEIAKDVEVSDIIINRKKK